MKITVVFEGRNFYAGCKTWARDRTIDFKKLLRLIQDQTGGEILETRYYMGVDKSGLMPSNAGERIAVSIKKIEAAGIQVKQYPLRLKVSTCPACEEESDEIVEKQVDTAIAVDCMLDLQAGLTDLYVLVSSDTDQIPLVEQIRLAGKRCWIVAWKPEAVSNALAQACENIMVLEPHREEFLEPQIIRQPTTPARIEAMYQEIMSAEQQFKTGYVGLHYFLRSWKSPELPDDTIERSTLLNELIALGSVLQYNAHDGNIAIKTTRTK
jgi:uncharacterized LabA/DUF88 family protein